MPTEYDPLLPQALNTQREKTLHLRNRFKKTSLSDNTQSVIEKNTAPIQTKVQAPKASLAYILQTDSEHDERILALQHQQKKHYKKIQVLCEQNAQIKQDAKKNRDNLNLNRQEIDKLKQDAKKNHDNLSLCAKQVEKNEQDAKKNRDNLLLCAKQVEKNEQDAKKNHDNLSLCAKQVEKNEQDAKKNRDRLNLNGQQIAELKQDYLTFEQKLFSLMQRVDHLQNLHNQSVHSTHDPEDSNVSKKVFTDSLTPPVPSVSFFDATIIDEPIKKTEVKSLSLS